MQKYDHKKIEAKWAKKWQNTGLYKVRDTVRGKENATLLVEFPYPSGNLHVGHWYAFSVPDILARTLRMQGKNVLYPIGFDAFGLPAENAAIKHKLNPRTWTLKNIAYMKKQIESMGTSFDWSREVITCDPSYYKWTQWLFLQFFKAGLAYRKETAVNWCPKDKTVLANEQVVNGTCERCDSEVEQRQMLQWNIKITEYADRLVDDLDALKWPEQIKESQRNWIGRSEGAEIDFPLDIDTGVKRFVILHCKGKAPKDSYYPWLKKTLEDRGYEVQIPTLPNTEAPDDEAQADYVEKHCTLDQHTAIIGHSFGGIVALRLLERGHKVARVTLAATPYSGVFLDGKKRPTVKAACKKGFDFETIKKHAGGFIVLPDSTDKVIPVSDAAALVENLGGTFVQGRGVQPHFQASREPDILMASTPTIRVFTTRADTLYGATYLVLAPEHPWLSSALGHPGRAGKTVLKNNDEVKAYVAQAKKKTELERQADQKEKTGVELRGVKAINPATGTKIPLYVADYVLGHYGTGAVMGVPAHDARDGQFAKKYDLPIVEVVEPLIVRTSGLDTFREKEKMLDRRAVMAVVKHWSEDRYLAVHYKPTDVRGFVTGGIEEKEEEAAAAMREIREETGYTSARFVQKLGSTIHSRYYSLKYGNLQVQYVPLLMQLENDSRVEISAEEKNDHDVSWMTKQEFDAFINREDMRIAWNRVQGRSLYGGEGILTDSGSFDGHPSEEARRAIAEQFGRPTTSYKLRDWIVSRQRYWGVPIPIIHCPACGPVAVPDKDLPVKLPEVKDYLPEGSGKSPLAKAKKWVAVKCPKCKGKAERETDTLDTFVDSSWYFLRYADPKNKTKFADPKKLAKWMPITLYSGGAEHTTMHVLYSRFWQKALFDLGLVKDAEPYTRRMNRSIILGPDGQKMSKSRGNVIDPDQVVEQLGADTVRMYLAFIGPYNEVATYPWNPDSVVGVRRFLERVVKAQTCVSDEENEEGESILHRTIKKVGDDIQTLKFNTAISQLMIFLNHVEKTGQVSRGQWDGFIRLLAPFAPFLSEELWHEAGHRSSVHEGAWPSYEPDRLKETSVTIAVQVNGKTRGTAQVASGSDSIAQEAAALSVVSGRLVGKKIIRTVVVPGRLVNFVLEE